MDLTERLSAIGMSKADFARAMGVSNAAVSQWKEIPDHAEAKLKELEGVGIHIQPGNLVRMGDETFRVIRRDHCVNFSGSESWIYWISPAKPFKGGYATNGQTTRCPEKLLTDLGEVEWVEFEKPDQSKGSK